VDAAPTSVLPIARSLELALRSVGPGYDTSDGDRSHRIRTNHATEGSGRAELPGCPVGSAAPDLPWSLVGVGRPGQRTERSEPGTQAPGRRMPGSGPPSQLAGHPLDLAFDARTELGDGGGIARMRLQLVQLGLLSIALEIQLLVAEQRVVSDVVRLNLQGFAALGPREVPWLRTHG
jgi:hypothetical protein